MGPYLPMQNYTDIAQNSVQLQNYLHAPAEKRKLYRNRAPRRGRAGVKERKPPGKGGFTPSKQPAGRSLFDAQKSIPRSAERGKGVAP